MNRAIISALLLSLVIFALPVGADEIVTDEKAAIEATIKDYIEGWYTGDADRMERALHPNLAKRRVRTIEATGRSVLDHVDAAPMVEYTRAGAGKKYNDGSIQCDITILDQHGGMASVRVDSKQYIDYVHLAKYDGQWRIINVLWELRE